MRCTGCATDYEPAELNDGDLCDACVIDRHNAANEPPRPDAHPRIRSRGELIETFEERFDQDRRPRIVRERSRSKTYGAQATLARVEQAEAHLAQRAVSDPRECPVCRRMFKGARVDRITCPDGNHCRDLVRRLRANDPTVEAALAMLWCPPDCAGCGEPLWAQRPDARHHNQACVKRRQRKNGPGGQPPTDRETTVDNHRLTRR